MATVQPPGERYVDFDEFVDYQLDRARNGIKWTDILTAIAGVSSLVVGYLVLFVVADHWFFEGGVPRAVRLTALLAVGTVSIAWLGAKVVLPYLRRVNGLYAARMLEQAEPTLRGSLFGLVDSRRSGRVPVDEVRRALEKRAATTLSSIDVETAMDRRPLMRMSYLLLAIVLVACAYAILSPKRIGPSLLRALAPRSSIGVATRTEILDVRPGNATVIAGTQIDVEVLIRGEAPEKVYLYYSTDDRRFVDEPIEMRLTDETTRAYRAALIGDAGRGLTQDVTYRIEANDDAAGPFAVTVDQPPAATITSLTLEYPAYTRREREIRDAASIDAIEGTKITLKAEANQPLKTAKIVFADDEQFLSRGEEVQLRVDSDGKTLTAEWPLILRSDGTSPNYYRIECRDLNGKTNPDPAVYPIKIRADQPPEITLVDPKSDIERPANAVVPIIIDARDPDFELREILLRLARQGQELPERTVLWEGTESTTAVRYDWDLAPLGLKPGEVITFYAQARDNREPESNRRNTPKLNITIREPISKEAVQEQLAQERQRQDEELASTESNETATEQGAQPDSEMSEELETDAARTPDDANQEDRPQDETEETQGSQSSKNQDSRNDAPVKNDGSQDDEVLRRLIENQREQRRPVDSDEKRSQSDEKQSQEEERQSGDEADSQDSQSSERGKQTRVPKERSPSEDGDRSESEPSESADSNTNSQDRQRPQNTEQSQQNPHSQNQDKNGGKPSSTGESQASQDSGTSGNSNSSTQNPPEQSPNGSSSQSDGEAANPSQSGNEASKAPSSADGETGDAATEPGMEMGSDEESPSGESSEKGTSSAGSEAESSDDQGMAASEDQSANPNQTSSSSPNDNEPGADSPSSSASDETDPANATSKQSSDAAPPNAKPATNDPSTGDAPRDQQMKQPGDTGPSSSAGETEDSQSTQSSPSEKTPGSRSQGDLEKPIEGSENTSPSRPKSTSEAGEIEKQSRPKNSDRTKPRDGQPDQASNERPSDSQSSETAGGSSESSEEGSEGASRSDAADGKPPEDQKPAGAGGESKDKSANSSQGGSKEDKSGDASPGSPSADGGNTKGESGNQSDESPSSGKTDMESSDSQSPSSKPRDSSQNGEGNTAESEPNAPAPDSGKSQQSGSQTGKTGSEAPSGSNSSASKAGTNPGNGGSASSGQADQTGSGNSAGSAAAPDAANEEFAKQATDLALKNLENDLRRGDVDPELLRELGWTEDDMKRFAERLRKNLSEPTGNETPEDAANRLEFHHMLENLSFGETSSPRKANADRVKDVGDVGTVNPHIPSEYRDAFEDFTRNIAGRRAVPNRSK